MTHMSVRTMLQWKSESAILIVLNRILPVHILGVGMACFGCIHFVGLIEKNGRSKVKLSTGSASH